MAQQKQPAWTPDLERLLLQALLRAWLSLNDDLFGGAMRPPLFFLDSGDSRRRLGEWRRSERRLTLSLPLVRERPWHVVRAVLKHEMAHQYVDEFLGVHDERAHGPAFVAVCGARHIDARAAGLPDDVGADDVHVGLDGGAVNDDAARVLRRVQKLLALAESDNLHEAENAANAAQRLMLEHNLLVVQRAGTRNYLTRRLGVPVTRMPAHEKMLGGLLAAHYFVHCIIARAYVPDLGDDAFFLELAGTAENLAMAEFVFHFLLRAGERALADEVKAGRLARADRRRFLAGFVAGFGDKLRAEQTRQAAVGLVWTGDPDLLRHVRREHPRMSTSRVSTTVDEAHAVGRSAGRDVVIARPVEAGTATRNLALGPSR